MRVRLIEVVELCHTLDVCYVVDGQVAWLLLRRRGNLQEVIMLGVFFGGRELPQIGASSLEVRLVKDGLYSGLHQLAKGRNHLLA